jgi:hypothetical protein
VTTLNVLFALFAVYMLVRYAPRALRLLRREEPRENAFVALVNVLLALAILGVAFLLLSVKWLGGWPISR